MFTFGKTCFRTSRQYSLINDNGMTFCIDIIINVGISAITSIGCITFIRTSRSGYNSFVVVSFCFDFSDFAVITICADSDFRSFVCASWLFGNGPITETVSCCVDIVVNIGISTRAGIGCITFFRTGRSCYNGFIIMSFCFDFSGFAVIAICADSDFFALVCASRFFGNSPITETVSCCVDIVVNIGISARAGIGCITFIRTGRSCYNGFIIMSFCFDFSDFAVITICADSDFFALVCASWLFGNSPIAKTVTFSRHRCLRYEYFSANITVRTLGETRFGTSRFYRFVGNRGMTERGNDFLC